MNYTITLTYSEFINIAALLSTHIELCKDLSREAEASEFQATLDKIWFRIAGRPDPEKVQSMTNADKIRAMTNEQIAMLLNSTCPTRECPEEFSLNQVYDCNKCWLDWLRQEVPTDD